jgi:hypothetical protein
MVPLTPSVEKIADLPGFNEACESTILSHDAVKEWQGVGKIVAAGVKSSWFILNCCRQISWIV